MITQYTITRAHSTSLNIEYKLLSLTYKVLTTTQPSCLHNLITVQPLHSTRSSSLVTLAHPSTSSSLRIIDHSFQYASSHLRNQLPTSLCQRRTNLSNSDSPSPTSGTCSISSIDSQLSLSITTPSFIPGLKLSFSANPAHCNLIYNYIWVKLRYITGKCCQRHCH